jgi:hypothetical protein
VRDRNRRQSVSDPGAYIPRRGDSTLPADMLAPLSRAIPIQPPASRRRKARCKDGSSVARIARKRTCERIRSGELPPKSLPYSVRFYPSALATSVASVDHTPVAR